MTAGPRGRSTRLPFRGAAAVLAAFAAVLLTLGVTGGAGLVPGALSASSPAVSPAPSSYSSDTRPYGDDAYVGARTVLTRPERDAGERTVSAGHPLFTAAYTPPVPPRPARPAPVAGHVPSTAAHMPSDLGRAPPAASST
ncbi:hypothetical protein ACFVZC_34135 [Streptomyces marokkonensis]|uniref:Uncharacterized protein n=1 Tax=Streptomyces marokkonensis TaxID=324855 RepID=A0ABW6QGL4_9ACTN|nr:hypothetical protein [Streptomyces marokkonensis]